MPWLPLALLWLALAQAIPIPQIAWPEVRGPGGPGAVPSVSQKGFKGWVDDFAGKLSSLLGNLQIPDQEIHFSHGVEWRVFLAVDGVSCRGCQTDQHAYS